jgi:hypothetical protein
MSSRKGVQVLRKFCEDSVEIIPKLSSLISAQLVDGISAAEEIAAPTMIDLTAFLNIMVSFWLRVILTYELKKLV